MNYSKIYNDLIQRGKERIPNGYVERHHIVPRCMGGGDEKSNLVALYPEEHFIAHILLLKIHKTSIHRHSLAKAVLILKQSKNRKLHGWLRREIAAAHSANQSGKGNSQFGTMWICNIDLQENKKISKSDQVPEGWIKGRNKWITKNKASSEHLAYVRSSANLNKRFPHGFRWITDGVVVKKIQPDEPVPEGFRYGKKRKLVGL